ncbi:MAG: OB-fold domain-containing protein [Elusimicrobiota bacterium]
MEIYGYKCRKCGHINYPYRMRCGKCRKGEYEDFDPVALPKAGKLLTYTFVYNLPVDFSVPKLGLAIVELSNGVRMTGQLRAEEPKLGMKLRGEVEVVRQGEYEKSRGMVFYAA